MNQTVVTAGLLAAVGGRAGTGDEDVVDTVGEGRGTAVAVSAWWGGAGVVDDTGVDGVNGVDGVGGATEDGEVEGVRPAVVRPLGRLGCPAVAGGRVSRVRVGSGRAVLEVSGVAVSVGEGVRVGRDRSFDADGAGPGVPSSDAVSAQTPRPPATRTAAAPTIHGALRCGRR
ncbi:hypothetical protein [Streptomyces sp. T028]|uniref:hypothetical protein n=1 Tax=Streptomyces sp. T028 TaxID=3394379 RepID=UPI003A85FD75